MEEMTSTAHLLHAHTHTHTYTLTLTEYNPEKAGWSVISRCVTQIVTAIDDI